MSRYVDGRVPPVPKKNPATYRGIVRPDARTRREHGALAPMESAGVNLKAMQDPRIAATMATAGTRCVHRRMLYGDFKTLVPC